MRVISLVNEGLNLGEKCSISLVNEGLNLGEKCSISLVNEGLITELISRNMSLCFYDKIKKMIFNL
jgi:hypothetical protein